MKYNSSFFKENLPEWKRKKDPICVRYIYRPLSFYLSAFFANHHIKANYVTLISLIPAILTGSLLFVNCWYASLISAIMISVWLLLDCADGNLARNIEKQPYGGFLDALGSYLLVAFLGIGLGVYLFNHGGLIWEYHNPIWIVMGAFISICDLLMRVTHQNFKNATLSIIESGVIIKQKNSVGDEENIDIITRIKLEFGIGGIIPPAMLILAYINRLDLVLFYLLVYNTCSCLAIVMLYIKKAMSYINYKL